MTISVPRLPLAATHCCRPSLTADVLQKDIPKAEATIYKHKVSKGKLKVAVSRLAKEMKKRKNQPFVSPRNCLHMIADSRSVQANFTHATMHTRPDAGSESPLTQSFVILKKQLMETDFQSK